MLRRRENMDNDETVYVWDLFIRSSHWVLTILVFFAYLTGDERTGFHRQIGQVVLGLVMLRVIWGFIGTRHARFSDFCCSPARGLAYLRGLLTGKSTRSIGHNPAAAWMILFLLAGSAFVCLSGYAAMVEKRGAGRVDRIWTSMVVPVSPFLAGDRRGGYGERHRGNKWSETGQRERQNGDGYWSEVHGGAAQVLLALILVHVAGVVASSAVHRENLIRSMLTGYKTVGKHP
jgi:cytochrome b